MQVDSPRERVVKVKVKASVLGNWYWFILLANFLGPFDVPPKPLGDGGSRLVRRLVLRSFNEGGSHCGEGGFAGGQGGRGMESRL
jgi:hypothetical protein